MGAVAVPVNSFLAAEEINYILENSGACALITTAELYQPLTSRRSLPDTVRQVILAQGVAQDCLSLDEVCRRGDGHPELSFADSTAPAVIIYTSGTTGRPKGAVLSHANLRANVQACSQAFPLSARDRFLVFLPLFHSFTMTVSLLLPIYAGARIVLLPGIGRKLIRQAIKKHRPTILLGVPAVYNMLANADLSRLARWLNPLRICICGGAPLPQEVRQRFENKYRCSLLEGYGLSEASPVVSINPQRKAKPCSVGPPLPGVQVKVVNEDGQTLPPGEVGELLVSGPNVMQGYWQNPAASEGMIKDGWLYTGDLARLDEDGYIYVVDRKKELIIVRGMNVYPREVEDVLYRHPAIAEAAVIGIPDPQRGEVPKAVVVLKENSQSSEGKLKDFCRQHLAPYKVPHQVEFRSELPKTGSGKISKRHLKDKHNA